VVVPILGQDSVVGVVEVLSSRAAAFSMQHVAELQHIAQLLAPILPREEPAQSELPEEKRHLSMTVAGAVFLLGLLLLRLEFQYRPSKLSPAATYPSARAAANPTEVPTNSEGAARHEAEPAQSFTASDQSEVEAPPTALSPSPLLQPDGTSAAAARKPPGEESPGTTTGSTARVTPLSTSQSNLQPPTGAATPPPVESPAHNTLPSPAMMATLNSQPGGKQTGAESASASSALPPTLPVAAPTSPIAYPSGDHPQPDSGTSGDVHIQQAVENNGLAGQPADFREPYGNIPLGKYFELGKFKDESEANEAAESVTQAGFHPTVVERSHLWTKFYHVLAGPFGSEDEAEAARSKLASDGFAPQNLPKQSRTLTLLSRTSGSSDRDLRLDDFVVAYESYSPDALVRFLIGGTVVKTAQAKWVSREVPYAHDEIMYRGNGQGSRTLLELHFAGVSQALVVTDNAQPIVF